MREIDLGQVLADTYGCRDIEELRRGFDIGSVVMFKEAAKEVCMQVLELAAENATAHIEMDDFGERDAVIEKESILRTINQVK